MSEMMPMIPVNHVHTARTDVQMMAVDVTNPSGGPPIGQLILRFCSDLTCKAVFWEQINYGTRVPVTRSVVLKGNQVSYRSTAYAVVITPLPGKLGA